MLKKSTKQRLLNLYLIVECFGAVATDWTLITDNRWFGFHRVQCSTPVILCVGDIGKTFKEMQVAPDVDVVRIHTFGREPVFVYLYTDLPAKQPTMFQKALPPPLLRIKS